MERILVKLLKKRWLAGANPAVAVYTFKRIVNDIQKFTSDEFAKFNLFPKLKLIIRSRSCPYFFIS